MKLEMGIHCCSLVFLFTCACGESTTPGPDQGGAGGADSALLDGEGGGGRAEDTEFAGAGGESGATAACEGQPLDCDDCPTLDAYRESCAPAAGTTCRGTVVGPLRAEDSEYSYCYAADGTLIGRIVDDLSSSSADTVQGWGCDAQGARQSLCGDDKPPPVLEENSEAIAISYFSFFQGGYRFQRRLDQLTAQQLELARAIQVVPPTGECWEDSGSVSLTVTAGDDAREFLANEHGGTCGRDGTLVDMSSVMALLDTAACLPAKSNDATSPQTAPTLSPDDGCQHGLFNAHRASPEWWFRAEIPAASEYSFVVAECGDRALDLELFEDDATTRVAKVVGDGACPTLTHSFDGPGTYLLRVNMVGGSYAGDFFMSFESSSAR